MSSEIHSLEEKIKNYEKTLDEIHDLKQQISGLHTNKTELFKRIAKNIDEDMNSYQIKFFRVEEKLEEDMKLKESE